MKKFLATFTKWFMLGAIILVFLILPDFVPQSPDSAWIIRAFFTFFLCNAFFGLAEAFNNRLAIEKKVEEQQKVDKETLIVSYVLGHLFFIVSTIGLCFYGLYAFYPTIGYWKYLFGIFHGTLISSMHYNVIKIQLRQLRKGMNN